MAILRCLCDEPTLRVCDFCNKCGEIVTFALEKV